MRQGTKKVICWMLFEIQFILSSHFFLHYKVATEGTICEVLCEQH